MVWIGEREIKMPRRWIVQYRDGSVLYESDMLWKKLPNKKDIRRVVLKWEDRLWSLDDKEHYTVPVTRGYMDVNSGFISGGGVHSRAIGYYDVENKCRVYLRVEDATGKMDYYTEPF